MYETSTDFLLFLVSVIRSEICWAKQVQDMLVSPVFCKAVDIILSNGRIKRTFFEKQPHISKFVGVLYDTGSFSPNIIQIHKMRQYFWMKRLK